VRALRGKKEARGTPWEGDVMTDEKEAVTNPATNKIK
jgi:hypothetical protein